MLSHSGLSRLVMLLFSLSLSLSAIGEYEDLRAENQKTKETVRTVPLPFLTSVNV